MPNHIRTPRKAGRHLKYGLCLSAFSILYVTVQAEGFRNPPAGTFDLGRAGGRIAQVDDASSVQQNPANMLEVTNAEALFTPSIIYIASYFSSPSGQTTQTTDPWKVVPNFFISVPLKNDRFAAGLGVTVPYGLSVEWNRNSSAFNQFNSGSWSTSAPYYSELTTYNFNPSFAAKLGERVQLGVGFDVMWSDLEFKQLLSNQLPGLEAVAEGDGVGFGGNGGVTWLVTDHQRLAAAYRSPMTIDYTGTAKFNNYPGGVPGTSFGSQVRFPTIVSVGYGIEINDKLRLEADGEWVQFSRFKSLQVNVGANNALGVPSQNIPENWRDTFTAGLAGDWKFADDWVLRFGYQFYQSPVPDSTFSPTIPDADQNVFTLGLGFKFGHSSFEGAYGLDFYNERTITNDQNPVFDGKYKFNVHLFSLAYRYSF